MVIFRDRPARLLAQSILSLGVRNLLCACITILAFGGCTASIQGAPDRLLPVAAEAEFAKRLASPEWYAEYAISTGARRRELRDQIVLARMYAIDLYYSEYEARLTRERQNVGFYSTVASLALTSSATLFAANETKTILSAVATGLTGTREAYDKEILIEKTITISAAADADAAQRGKSQDNLTAFSSYRIIPFGTGAPGYRDLLSRWDNYWSAYRCCRGDRCSPLPGKGH